MHERPAAQAEDASPLGLKPRGLRRAETHFCQGCMYGDLPMGFLCQICNGEM
jgi:hypothetical protein